MSARKGSFAQKATSRGGKSRNGPGGGFVREDDAKKPKQDFASQGDDFDDAPDAMEMEFEEYDDPFALEGQEPVEIEEDQGESLVPNSRRPPLKELPNPETDDITFQQVDIDHYIGAPHQALEGNLSTENEKIPIVRVFGVTKDEHSVMFHIHGFIPYMYVKLTSKIPPENLEKVRSSLNDALISDSNRNKDGIKQAVLSVEVEEKESMYGFSGNVKSPFLKINLALPSMVAAMQRILEKGSFASIGDKCFESNVEYDIRFMVDADVVGCNWIQMKAGKYTLRTDPRRKVSRCQIEGDVYWKDFISHAPEGEWSAVAPLRVMSFDIECAGRRGIFPEPEKDPVIQIATVVQRQGEKEPFIRTVFTLHGCAPIIGVKVVSKNTEKELLTAWADLVREIDPDIITGYNIQNFDLWYLLSRAETLGTITFPFLGRIRLARTNCRRKVLQSKQMGRRENKEINIEGRAQFDLLLALVRDYKLRSYSLNAVSYHFIGEQKEDVHHSIITDLHNGDDMTRRRLAVYCVKDAYLPLRLLDKLMCIINYMEMARVTGVPLGYLLTRGQQIKVVSQLLRKAKSEGLLMPAVKPQQGDDFEGALVIEPKKGFYEIPIATLDFTSLYPSIMMAHNLCYTTLLPSSARSNLKEDQYIQTPVGSYFVKSSLRKGLLPRILEDLLGARKKAKEDLKRETDPFKRQVLDGRQLALKISANSVYGFTGAQVGRLPCLDISKSVTAFGRKMIDETKNIVEANFTIDKGYPANAEVVYGDTDSVMVKFGCTTVAQAMELGREAATLVTSKFIRPINLDFEKVYYPYLLINKKRYAGLYWTKPEKWDKMDCKGIETVRRDNCPLVSHLIGTCLQKLLIDRSPKDAIKHAQKTIADLLQNRVDISQLIISKELTKTDAEYAAKQAHVELAARMAKRDAGSAPKLGDRVPYVITAAAKGTAAYLKSEDPIYVLENSIPIDVQYYLENQISKPLLRIFEPVLGESKATQLLLKGDHTRTRTVVTSKTSRMAIFCTKVDTCLGCKTALRKENKGSTNAVCKYCESKQGRILQVHIARLQALEEKFARLWTECQRCQGSVQDQVICTSKDCPIFYMRTRAKKAIAAQAEDVARFGLAEW